MPPTRQQRYTCQISIGTTRKSPGTNSTDPPDVVLDSEWRQIEGNTYTGRTDNGQTSLQSVKQKKSVSPELEQFKRGTCTQTYTERTDRQTHPNHVQQEINSRSVSPESGQLEGGINAVITEKSRSSPLSEQQTHNSKSTSPEPRQIKRGTSAGRTDDGGTSPELGQFEGGTSTGRTDDDRTSPLSVQQTRNSKSASPELGQLEGGTSDDGQTSPELGQLEGGTYRNANRTEKGWINPESLQNGVDSVSPDTGQLKEVINSGVTGSGRTRPISVQQTDNSKSASPELGHLEGGTSTGRTDDGRTSPLSVLQTPNLKSTSPELGQLEGGMSDDGRCVQQEENSKPLTPELRDGVDDGRAHLQSLQWKGSSKLLSPKLRQSYLDFFNKADISNVGQLTVHQFRDEVVKLGFTGTTLQIAAMFADLNPNDDLVVTLDAFMTEMCKTDSRKWTPQDLADIFQFLDVDGDGLITEKDIETSLERQDKVKMDDIIQRMIREYDFDRDGALSLQDFQKGCQRNQRKHVSSVITPANTD